MRAVILVDSELHGDGVPNEMLDFGPARKPTTELARDPLAVELLRM